MKLSNRRVLRIRVAPKAGRNLVREEPGGFKVYLTKPAQDGLANKQLLELLAGYLGIKIYRMKIIRGQRARDKLVEIT